MIERIKEKLPCIVAWGLALLVPLTLFVGIGWPWLERTQALQGEIESLGDQITRYERLLQTLPALQAELEQVRSNKDVEDFFFEAKTPALAGAQVQRELKKMVELAGGRVISTQLLPSTEDEQPPKVNVRTQIQGKTDVLLDVLYQIEKARPFLFVEQLSVRAPAQRTSIAPNRRTPRRLTRRPRSQQLQVRLDVVGYALGETP